MKSGSIEPCLRGPAQESSALINAGKTGLLLLAPMVWLVWFAWERCWDGGSGYLAGTLDPTYAYLFNGLALATGHWVPMCVHPGSPVFILFAGLLRGIHPLCTSEELAKMVLADPEYYLAIANWGLVLFLTAVLAMSGWKIARVTGSMAAGLLFQFAPFLSVQATAALHGVRPEVVMLICGVGFACSLVCQAFEENAEVPNQRLGLWGFLLGAGTAAKVHFCPLVLPAVMAIRDWRGRIRLALWVIATFALLTIPSWPAMAGFIDYILMSSTHVGQYGAGAHGFPGPALYLANLFSLVNADKSFFGLLLLSVIAMPFLSRTVGKKIQGLLLMQILSVLVIAQHPSGRYLTPIISTVSALMVLIFMGIRPHLNRTGWAIVSVIAIVFGTYKVSNTWQNRRIAQAAQEERSRLNKILERDYHNSEVVPYFQRSDPDFALFYGNITSNQLFSQFVAERLQKRLFYDRFENCFRRGVRKVDLKEIRNSGHRLILTGGLMSAEDKASMEHLNGFKLRDVFGGWIETAYEVQWMDTGSAEPKRVQN